QRPAAVIAPPARPGGEGGVGESGVGEGGIVKTPPQEHHPALIGFLIRSHCLLLGQACLFDPDVSRGIVNPWVAGGEPPATNSPYGSFDVENFKHEFQSGAA